MIERAFIHVGGPPGSGKTALIEAVLARCDLIVLAARCRRDDSLAEPRESYPQAAPEFRRYQQAGAIGRALFEFPGGADTDAFFMTGLMSGYSQAVILEGDMPFDFQDLDVFVAGRPTRPSGRAHLESGLDVIARHCAARLEVRLARPARAEDDWSIELPEGCRCELCQTLGAFLGDPARRTFEWPLAEQGRRHVHGRIDQGELPVRHQTRRTGRPYTLVLSKTDALFAREREARRRDQTDLAWLGRTFVAR